MVCCDVCAAFDVLTRANFYSPGDWTGQPNLALCEKHKRQLVTALGIVLTNFVSGTDGRTNSIPKAELYLPDRPSGEMNE